MDVMKVSIEALHKLISDVDYGEIYDTLKVTLPKENFIFAEFRIGSGYYLWRSNDDGWICVENAPFAIVEKVRQECVSQFANIRTQLNLPVDNNLIDHVLTIPSDEFLFYCQEGDNIKILLTAWGYEKPVIIEKPRIDDEIKHTENEVTFAFTRGGETLVNYPFKIKVPSGYKMGQTNGQGKESLGILEIGHTIELEDIESGKHFTIVASNEKSHYDFDVTENVTVKVFAIKDGSPMANVAMTLNYKGQTYTMTTDASGTAMTTSLVYHKGETCVLEINGETITTEIVKPETIFKYEYTTPISHIIVKVTDRGNAKKDCACKVSYNGKSYDLTTDNDGCCSIDVTYQCGAICEAVVNGQAQSKELSQGANEFLFADDTPLPLPIPRDFKSHILIEGEKGFIGRNYPIIVEYKGVVTEYVGDSDGKVHLPMMTEGNSLKVTDGFNPNNVQTFVLDADQDEYIFKVPFEPVTTDHDINVTVLDKNGKPIANKLALFRQNGKSDLLSVLSDHGTTGFAFDTFAYDKPIQVIIKTDDNRYAPFEFQLEKEETEYVLQEYGGIKWYTVLGEILAVIGFFSVVTIIGCFVSDYLNLTW